MSERAVQWLREQIEGDKSAALIVSDGGFEPERWDTLPADQVNPATIETGNAVSDALGLEENERPYSWVTIHAWNRLNNEPPEADGLEWGAPVAIVDGGRRQFDHIRRQDPRNTVARCEAELAILDEHRATDWTAYGDHMCHRCADFDDDDIHETAEPDRSQLHSWRVYPCKTIQILASGYRHRAGWAEHWGNAG